jgi:hypothetical protein
LVASRGQRAAIDRELAELVYLLWQHKIGTGQSCRGFDGEDAYVVLLGQDAAEAVEALEVELGREWTWEELKDDDGQLCEEYVVSFPLSDVAPMVEALRSGEPS